MVTNKPARRRPKKKNSTIIVALIAAIATIAAATVTGIFGWFAATANWQQKAKESGWIPKDDWQQLARENNWILKSECKCTWKSFIAEGEDGGKSIGVKINVLSQEYRWLYGKVGEIVEVGGKEESLRPHLSNLDISGSKAIISIGAASVEGNKSEQKELALGRAIKLKELIKSQLEPKVPIYTLNLGRAKYGEIDPNDQLKNASQRRVIVVEIINQDEGVNLNRALYNALVNAKESNSQIPFDVRDYFNFDLDLYTQ